MMGGQRTEWGGKKIFVYFDSCVFIQKTLKHPAHQQMADLMFQHL